MTSSPVNTDLNIEFISSKNGSQTVKINGIFLHSAYNPQRESESFVNNLCFPIKPDFIFITEPGISYTLPLIKQKYPFCKIITLRYNKAFESFNSDTYFSIPVYSAQNENELSNILLSNFTEIQIMSSVFISWQPSEKNFQEQSSITWKAIQNTVTKARTLLITRGFFEKRWLINTCNFLKYGTNFVKINDSYNNDKSLDCSTRTKKPVVIAGSGPSLKNAVEVLQKFRANYFLIGVSSAINALHHYNLTPDLYLSSDGGWYAGKHLSSLSKNKDIPLALPAEAFCQKNLLTAKDTPILPLIYSDGLSRKLTSFSGINFFEAERNGTVTGTAFKFAQSILKDKTIPVFFCGLDLACQKGFQHTSPNNIEKEKYFFQNRLNPLSKMTVPGEFGSESLKIYEDWFKNTKTVNKTYRIITKAKNSLGNIKDITPDEFENLIKNMNYSAAEITDLFILQNNCISKNESSKKIFDFINNNSMSDEWIENLFPIDYVALKHAKTSEEACAIKNKIDEKNNKFLQKLFRILQ